MKLSKSVNWKLKLLIKSFSFVNRMFRDGMIDTVAFKDFNENSCNTIKSINGKNVFVKYEKIGHC